MKIWGFLDEYPDCWPIDDIVKTIYENAAGTKRKQKRQIISSRSSSELIRCQDYPPTEPDADITVEDRLNGGGDESASERNTGNTNRMVTMSLEDLIADARRRGINVTGELYPFLFNIL
jgi:hypothetical protein